MSPRATPAVFHSPSDGQGATQPFGDTANLLLVTSVTRLPPRHGRGVDVGGGHGHYDGEGSSG